MLDNSDLNAAVRAGVVTEDTANSLRSLAASRRSAPSANEERFRLVDGAADLMTFVGLGLILTPLAVIAVAVQPLAAILVMGLSWALAEHFTRKRRLALTSFLLFGIFALAAAILGLGTAFLVMIGDSTGPGSLPSPGQLPPLSGLVVAVSCSLGCAGWWSRFKSPVAFAVAAVSGANVLIHCMRLIAPDMPAGGVSWILLFVGIALLALAVGWDASDIRRETKRADVGFWLHAVAGFQIAGASYRLILGVPGDPVGWDRLYVIETLPAQPGTTLLGCLLFAAFAIFALAVDRRSLIMASLAFLIPALAISSGGGLVGWLVGAMLVGVLLSVMSAYWSRLRPPLLASLPVAIRAQLPRTSITNFWPRPVY